MSVGFFKAGLLRTISSPDYPGQEGTKYYAKVQVQEPDFTEIEGTARMIYRVTHLVVENLPLTQF